MKTANRQTNTLRCLGLITLFIVLSPASGSSNGLAEGSHAPAFKLTTLDGKTYSSPDRRHHKPVYLKFWATWCAYCIEEMPQLQALHERYGDQIQFIAVNVGLNQTEGEVRKYLQQHPTYSFPVYFDATGELVRKFRIIGTPAQFLLDQAGVVRYQSSLMNARLVPSLESLIRNQEGGQ